MVPKYLKCKENSSDLQEFCSQVPIIFHKSELNRNNIFKLEDFKRTTELNPQMWIAKVQKWRTLIIEDIAIDEFPEPPESS